MKTVKWGNFFVPGSAVILLLAGCFSPVTVVSPESGSPAITDPFTVNVRIGKAPQALSVAGPDKDRIKGDIRNIVQLIVVDETGGIAGFDEKRRANESEKETELAIDSIEPGHTYHFLLLMGHWERNYAAGTTGTSENYTYKDEPPTLLAVGLKDVEITGDTTVTITMWPIPVDTEFTTTNQGVPSASRQAEPEVTGGKPKQVKLLAVEWGITWKVLKKADGNGFEDLVKAQKVIDDGAGDQLLLKSKKTIVRGTGDTGDVINEASITGNTITLAITNYTSGVTRIDSTGSANFKLEYVPFNLRANGTNPNPWAAYNDVSNFDLSGTKEPVWIIRNGVNDLAQNTDTDFEHLGQPAYVNVNGNGAVAFNVWADGPPDNPGSPQPGDLVIKNGTFIGPSDSDTPKIGFTTDGYDGEAGAFYAVVDAGDPEPAYSAYTGYLGGYAAGEDHRGIVTLPGGSGNYDIYVILFKDGKVSAPIKINIGSVDIGVGWEGG